MKFVPHRGAHFHELRKVMGTSKHIDSRAAFYLKFLDRIPGLVQQEVQTGGTRSEALVKQGRDRGFPGIANRAALLDGALEDDQRRLRLDTKLFDYGFHGIEVDAENFESLEFRIRSQLVENGSLRLAGWTPIGVDFDED